MCTLCGEPECVDNCREKPVDTVTQVLKCPESGASFKSISRADNGMWIADVGLKEEERIIGRRKVIIRR